MAEEEKPKYVIIGIHGADVKTVTEDVARVRFFVGKTFVDEDFLLPVMPVDLPLSAEQYGVMLKPQLEERYAVLSKGGK